MSYKILRNQFLNYFQILVLVSFGCFVMFIGDFDLERKQEPIFPHFTSSFLLNSLLIFCINILNDQYQCVCVRAHFCRFVPIFTNCLKYVLYYECNLISKKFILNSQIT